MRSSKWASKDLFLQFIHPTQASDFAGKIVLDGGCGSGRFTRLAQSFGAKTVVGVDFSEAADAAYRSLRHLPNVHIVQGDLLNLPFKPVFDHIFSVAVLHHTVAPKQAFQHLADLLKPEGMMNVWVYGRENNGWITRFVDPIRHNITSRIYPPLLLFFCYTVAIPFYFLTKFIYRPLNRWGGGFLARRILFYNSYLYFFSDFSFREHVMVIFDHLVPHVASYVSREELVDWFDGKFIDVKISARTSNSWGACATKTPVAEHV